MRGSLWRLGVGLVLYASVAHAQTTPSAPAESTPAYPRFTFGTITYLQDDAELRERDGFNAFDVTRAYLHFSADLSPRITFRVTPDVRRSVDPSDGSLVFRLKFGYLDAHSTARNTWLRVGLHQTPWLDYEESVNRYRVQGQMFAEREGLIPGLSDFGIGAFKRVAGGRIDLQGGLYNGEGFAKGEADRGKSLQLRMTVVPFARVPQLRMSAFGDVGVGTRTGTQNLAIGMLSYEREQGVAIVQLVRATRPSGDTNVHPTGQSAFVEVRRGRTGPAGFLRLERLTRDLQIPATRRRAIGGGAYWLTWNAVRLGFVASLEHVRSTVPSTPAHEERVLLQTHVQF